MNIKIFGYLLVALLINSVSSAQTLCPDGSWVEGSNCELAPDGSWAGGSPELAPDGELLSDIGYPSVADALEGLKNAP